MSEMNISVKREQTKIEPPEPPEAPKITPLGWTNASPQIVKKREVFLL